MESLEYLTVILVILAVYLVGRLNILGQYLMALTQVLWFIIGFHAGLAGLMTQSAILFVLSIKAIVNWRKKLGEKYV